MKFDVQDIPDEFSYLREPTRRYGHIFGHEAILEFLENRTDSDIETLRAVATKIIATEHARPIQHWLRMMDAQDNDIGFAVSNMLSLINELGIPTNHDYAAMPVAEAKQKLWKEWELAEPFELCWLAEQTKKIFGPHEGRRFVVHALRNLPPRDKYHALMALYDFPTQANVRLVERYWKSRRPKRRPKCQWGILAALSGVDWRTLQTWLEAEGPLRDVAIDALLTFTSDDEVPSVHQRPPLSGGSDVSAIANYLMGLRESIQCEIQRKRLHKALKNVHQIVAP